MGCSSCCSPAMATTLAGLLDVVPAALPGRSKVAKAAAVCNAGANCLQRETQPCLRASLGNRHLSLHNQDGTYFGSCPCFGTGLSKEYPCMTGMITAMRGDAQLPPNLPDDCATAHRAAASRCKCWPQQDAALHLSGRLMCHVQRIGCKTFSSICNPLSCEDD